MRTPERPKPNPICAANDPPRQRPMTPTERDDLIDMAPNKGDALWALMQHGSSWGLMCEMRPKTIIKLYTMAGRGDLLRECNPELWHEDAQKRYEAKMKVS